MLDIQTPRMTYEPVSDTLGRFEVEPGGHSSREWHQHTHVIIGARGRGVLRGRRRRGGLLLRRRGRRREHDEDSQDGGPHGASSAERRSAALRHCRTVSSSGRCSAYRS